MLAGLKRVERTSLSDGIVEQITDLIARGALKRGDRIPSEHELCRQCGVGRTSVREALRSMAAMGMIESQAGGGTFVAADLEHLIQTRLLLESGIAAMAAVQATSEDLADLAQAIRGMRTALADPARYLEHDLQFHLVLARATQNPMLESLLSKTRAYLSAWIREALSQPAARARARLSVSEHQRILAALKKRDAEGARRAMSRHILSSSKDLRSSSSKDLRSSPLREQRHAL